MKKNNQKKPLWNAQQLFGNFKAKSRLNVIQHKWLVIIAWWKWCEQSGHIFCENFIEYQSTAISTVIIDTKCVKHKSNISRYNWISFSCLFNRTHSHALKLIERTLVLKVATIMDMLRIFTHQIRIKHLDWTQAQNRPCLQASVLLQPVRLR